MANMMNKYTLGQARNMTKIQTFLFCIEVKVFCIEVKGLSKSKQPLEPKSPLSNCDDYRGSRGRCRVTLGLEGEFKGAIFENHFPTRCRHCALHVHQNKPVQEPHSSLSPRPQCPPV